MLVQRGNSREDGGTSTLANDLIDGALSSSTFAVDDDKKDELLILNCDLGPMRKSCRGSNGFYSSALLFFKICFFIRTPLGSALAAHPDGARGVLINGGSDVGATQGRDSTIPFFTGKDWYSRCAASFLLVEDCAMHFSTFLLFQPWCSTGEALAWC